MPDPEQQRVQTEQDRIRKQVPQTLDHVRRLRAAVAEIERLYADRQPRSARHE